MGSLDISMFLVLASSTVLKFFLTTGKSLERPFKLQMWESQQQDHHGVLRNAREEKSLRERPQALQKVMGKPNVSTSGRDRE